jgi:Sec-independent protein translocase protein TatA
MRSPVAPVPGYDARMDLLIVLVVALILVVFWRGPKTLPLLGKAFGQGIREAKREIEGDGDKPDAKDDDSGAATPRA